MSLAAEGVVLWRGESPVLDEVSLTLESGELLKLEGENGSGKTTLLRVLAGLVEPDEGTVRFNGEPLPRARDALARALLWIGHRPGVTDAMSPLENLSTALVLAGIEPQSDRILAALEELGLGGREHQPVATLSAGQRRRVALARLALEPRAFWLLDEPLTALDARGLRWLGERLAGQIAGGGSVLMTTHQPLEVAGVVPRTVRLDRGRIVAPSSGVA